MRLARWVLVWERLWPGLVPPLSLAGFALALALFGVFAWLPGWLHLLALIGLAAGFAALSWRAVRRVVWPGPEEAARRLERDSGLAHRPLAAMTDRLGSDGSDPMGRVLWDIHRRRMAALAGRLRLGLPHPGMAALDPWGLRAVVPLLLVVAAVTAGSRGPARLAAALSPHVESLGLTGRVKVWITPPAYTKLPPMVLGSNQGQVIVPAGSRVTAILSGGWGRADLVIGGRDHPFRPQGNDSQRVGHVTVHGDRIAVRQAFQTVASWPIRVAVDALPSIAFTAPVAGGAGGLLHLAVHASDDYGVAAAWVTIHRNGLGPSGETRRVALPVSADHPRQVTISVWRDLTAWPWAGLPVTIRPMVKDTDGQVAGGLPVTVVLPRRRFTDPAARAIVRQRRRVIRDRANAPGAIRVLDAISKDPRLFKRDLATFLDMRLARRDLATPDFDLAEVQSLMWQAALRIEDGRAGLAKQNLQTASRALQQAIDSGASTARILSLLDRVRAALDRLAREVARRDRKGADASPTVESGGRVIDAGALAHMIDRMRALAESGSTAALRRMVQDLSRLMAHLSVAPQAPGPSARTMRALRDLARRQQALLDRSFRRNEQGVTPVAPRQQMPFFAPRPPAPSLHRGRGNGGGDAKAQAALRRALLRDLPRAGAGAARSLRAAARSMGRATKALSADDWQDAAPHQARALRSLNATIRRLQAHAANTVPSDPLGRPLPGFYGGGNDIPIPDHATLREAGKILRELRRRAGDWQRPQAERDYLDRLLRQF